MCALRRGSLFARSETYRTQSEANDDIPEWALFLDRTILINDVRR
jgi:hypothetical protein